MRLIQILVIVTMALATVEAAYLLWLLNTRLRAIYGSITAWRFIFAGFIQMFIEIFVGTLSVLPWPIPRWLRLSFVVGFCVLMVTKVTCYVIGFTLWARARKRLLDPNRWPQTQEEDTHEPNTAND